MTTHPSPICCPLFDARTVRVERHRLSVTQGEFTLYYEERRIERYGDDVRIISDTPASNGVLRWASTDIAPGDGRQILAGYAGLPDAAIIQLARRLYTTGAGHIRPPHPISGQA